MFRYDPREIDERNSYGDYSNDPDIIPASDSDWTEDDAAYYANALLETEILEKLTDPSPVVSVCPVCGASGKDVPCLDEAYYNKLVAWRNWRQPRDGDEWQTPEGEEDRLTIAWQRWINAPRPGDKDYIPF